MTKSQKFKYIERLVKKYQKTLHLTGWDISFELNDKQDKGNVTWAASMHSNPRYFTGHMEVYPSFWSDSKFNQERIVSHELSHCITAESHIVMLDLKAGINIHHDRITDVNERITEYLALLVCPKK